MIAARVEQIEHLGIGIDTAGAHVLADVQLARLVHQLMEARDEKRLLKLQAHLASYAGHRPRHGFAASAAEARASTLEIASINGHRLEQILARYVIQADKSKLRPGKRAGVGLRQEV